MCRCAGSEEEGEGLDCWICYDGGRTDAGALIRPCQCRGDVSSVHHNCLRRWLVEYSLEDPNPQRPLHCKVCRTPYQVTFFLKFFDSVLKKNFKKGGAAGRAGLAAGLHAAPLAADVRDRDGHVPERVRGVGARPVLHRTLHPTARHRRRPPRLLRQHQVLFNFSFFYFEKKNYFEKKK
jgi:RING-variant domain